MDTESIKLDVHVRVWPRAPAPAPASGFLSSVLKIRQDRRVQEFIIDENDDSVRRLGSYPDPSPYDPLIYLRFRDFQPNNVYQLLHDQLHDRVLSEQIADQIVAKTQRQRSQSLDLPQQPFFVAVSFQLTQKVYTVVPYNSAPLATEESPEVGDCAICLETLAGTEDYCQMPNCSHCFHESCITGWCNRRNNSCPLCRKPINTE